MRSPAISRSNWANESSMLSVNRPIEVVVLNCRVTETNEASWASSTSTIFAKSASDRVRVDQWGPRDLTGDDCEGPMAPAVPFEPVGMDKHGMGDAAPFAHKPRTGRQRNRPCRLLRVACLRVEVQAQLAQDRFGEAAERPLLEFVGL
jgi:hypothetical protein